MKIEHTAYQVADPPALARWYVEHLGLTIKRSQDASPFGYFLADEGDAGDAGVLSSASPGRP
jgi:catechol 2,3-dioxygenase-like lactoylglutathione lyase family enzyme